MRRTLIQLDEATYGKLRQQAFRQERSISAVVREMVKAGLEGKAGIAKPKRLSEFLSVAAGRSKSGRRSRVSERHDEALAAVFDK
jgi:plasmid stability protein